MTKKVFIIVRGVPGCGKSDVAQMIAGDGQIFTTDDYWDDRPFDRDRLGEAHVWNFMRFSKAVAEGAPLLVLANTSTQEWEFAAYEKLAIKAGYRVYSIIVENRHGGENTHGVPEAVCQAMERRFELRLYKDTKILRPLSRWGRMKGWLRRKHLWPLTK